MLKISVGVRIGTDKTECDDTALVGSHIINNDEKVIELDEPVCIGVADGVGGNNGGKDASVFVMNELANVDFEELDEESMKLTIQIINKKLLEFSKATLGKETMATTLSAIWIGREKSFLIHVGNTRAFVMRGSYLKQLTIDHTTYQWLISCGQNEAAENCNKNEIFACMGGNDSKLLNQLVVKKIFQENFPKALLITSDGIHEYMDIDSMEEFMNEECDDIEIVHRIIKYAESNGSKDDKSVLIMRRN